MYKVKVDDTPAIRVEARAKSLEFALDSSGMNPLEGLYATLAACAAVYAKKACKELGISAAGIHIEARPRAGKAGPLSLDRFETHLSFPAHFTEAQKAAVLESVEHCAVKQIVQGGAAVEFSCCAA